MERGSLCPGCGVWELPLRFAASSKEAGRESELSMFGDDEEEEIPRTDHKELPLRFLGSTGQRPFADDCRSMLSEVGISVVFDVFLFEIEALSLSFMVVVFYHEIRVRNMDRQTYVEISTVKRGDDSRQSSNFLD